MAQLKPTLPLSPPGRSVGSVLSKGACNHPAGFTLIELLVVLVIVGIIVTMAVLSVGRSPEDRLETEMERLATLLQLAKEESIFQARELGLGIWEYGYQFYRLDINDWRPISDDPHLQRRELPEAMRLRLFLEGIEAELADEPVAKPQIFILSSGEMSIFELSMEPREGFSEPHRLAADALGNLTLELADNE